jgi:hypothetical protein
VPGPPLVDLAAFGLRAGEAVRFRRGSRGHWHLGRLERIERDGSIGVRDDKGAARALPAELVEVAVSGPKGASRWEPLVDRMTRGDQLELF